MGIRTKALENKIAAMQRQLIASAELLAKKDAEIIELKAQLKKEGKEAKYKKD